MRKPLTVIIVTLSVVCTLKGMSRWSIQRIKAMLLCIVYCVWYLVCQHCWYKDQSMQCIECYVCKDCRYTGVCGSYTTPYTEYYEVWKLYSTLYKLASHLNIQLIFNPQKVLENWDSGLFNHTINTIYVNTVDTGQGSLMHSMLSMSTLSIQNTSTCFCP